MKKVILFFLLFTSAALAQGQKVYFVYVQTETPSPFFVKMGDKVLSSTSQGYIIIPSLRDSTYIFSIGSPSVTEKKFTVTVNHKDRGFLLKDFNGTWGLFDLQNLEVIYAAPEEKKPEPLAIRSDEFSRKLALAVDDPTLLFVYAKATPPVNSIAKQDVPVENSEKKTDIVQAFDTEEKRAESKVNDSAVQTVASSTPDTTASSVDALVRAAEKEESEKSSGTSDTALLADVKVNTDEKTDDGKSVQQELEGQLVSVNPVKDSVVNTEQKSVTDEEKPYQRTKVTRRSESSTTEGFGLVFLDEQDGKVDTIRILIPNPPVVYKTEADLRRESELASGTKELEKEVRTLPETKDTIAAMQVNPACIELATESDFKKLRKEMVSKDNEEDMVDKARKVFRTKCFTTAQVRLLGALFLTPGGRYSFFDAAYGHVSDPSEFGTLRTELSNDEYYLKRFKALIGE